MNLTVLLTLMLSTYAIPILIVYYKYRSATTASTKTRSISSIITSKEPLFSSTHIALPIQSSSVFQTRHFIAICMLIMAGFTVAYEYQRCVTSISRIWWSLASISVLLVGIFGVIFIPEHNPTHYIFAGAAFFAIVGFMVGHTVVACTSTGTGTGTRTDIGTCVSDNLRILLYAQIIFMVITIIGVLQVARIFAIEALFLLNFAVFYLYIHFNNNK